MSALVPDATPWGAAVCSTCSRAAFFQARIESPAGPEPARRANACASHLVEIIELLGAWARDSQLAGSTLTVLAIDPYALPRMTALGLPESGFAFYTTPVTGRPMTGRPITESPITESTAARSSTTPA